MREGRVEGTAAADAGGGGLGTTIGEVRVGEGDCSMAVWERFDLARDVDWGGGVLLVGFDELLPVVVEGFWVALRVGFAFGLFVVRELV